MIKRGVELYSKKRRKSQFFEIDAMIAIAVLIAGIIYVKNIDVTQPEIGQGRVYSEESIKLLRTMRIMDLDESVIAMLEDSGMAKYTNRNFTLAKQISIYFIKGDKSLAENLTKTIFDDLIPLNYGYSIVMMSDGIESLIYNRSWPRNDQNIAVAKTMITGLQQTKPIIGKIARLYLGNLKNTLSRYNFFGGYVGQGNITFNINIPADSEIKSTYFEGVLGSNASIYINGEYCDMINGTNLSDSGSLDDITMVYLKDECNNKIIEGDNEIRFHFETCLIQERYIGGGFFRVNYETDKLVSSAQDYETKYLPGIDGLINLYDSFFVDGTLENLSMYIHLNKSTNILLFVNIGSEKVYDFEAGGEYNVSLTDSVLRDLLNYSSISNMTVPIRVGLEERNGSGIADIVLITDRSGSMENCMNDGRSLTSDGNPVKPDLSNFEGYHEWYVVPDNDSCLNDCEDGVCFYKDDTVYYYTNFSQIINVSNGTALDCSPETYFYDEFEADLSVNNWVIDNSGGGDAGRSDYTSNSGNYSLYVRWDAVNVSSKTIDLSGKEDLSLYYWARGKSDNFTDYFDDKDNLVVEYYNNGGNWIQLDTFSGKGIENDILAGWWNMDSAAEITDNSGNGNDGTNYGASYTGNGKINGAYYFDGDNNCTDDGECDWDSINCGDDASLALANDTLSIEFWLNGTIQASEGWYSNIFIKTDWGKPAGWQIQVSEHGPEIYMRIDTTAVNNSCGGGVLALDGEWHHFVYTINNGTVKAYKDGEYQNRYNYEIGGGISAPNSDFRISAYGDFNGTIDEVRLWNKSLSENEIKWLYNLSSLSNEITRENVLPLDAYHNGFKLRFRQTGGDGTDYDYWYIDDVKIAKKREIKTLGECEAINYPVRLLNESLVYDVEAGYSCPESYCYFEESERQCIECNPIRINLSRRLDLEFTANVLEQEGNKLALVGYGSDVENCLPQVSYLTDDKLFAEDKIKQYEADCGGTCTPCALKKSMEILNFSTTEPTLLDEGLVAWWDMDSATEITDNSGNGNDGTNDGASYTGNGKTNGAYYFDGNGDYVKVADSDSLDISDEIAIDAWIKADEQMNVFRDDDGMGEVTYSGDGDDDGVNKWLFIDDVNSLNDTASLWVYGKARNCKVNAEDDYRLRVNDNHAYEISFNWCDIFGLDYEGAKKDSDYEWVRFEIPVSWLQNGENKFNFWDTGGSCSWHCANWELGFDTDNYVGRSAFCSNCGLGTDPAKGIFKHKDYSVEPAIVVDTIPGEAMIYLTDSRIINKGDAYGIEIGGDRIMSYINNRGKEFALDSSWNHIITSFDGNSLSLFINGNGLTEDMDSVGLIETNGDVLKIGDFFKGTIDEVKIYNTSLSESEIRWIYGLEGSNRKREKYIVLMSDGEATAFIYPDGSIGWDEEIARNQTIEFAREACRDYNITLYAIAFGSESGSENLNASVEANKEYGCEGKFFEGLTKEELKDIYTQIAIEINFNTQGSSEELVDADNTLFPDSYIEYYVTKKSTSNLLNSIKFSSETERFGSCSKSIDLSGFDAIDGARLTSYSADLWTSNVRLNSEDIFNLADFGDDFAELGDPFIVGIPSNKLPEDRKYTIDMRIADKNTTEEICSGYNRMIYSAYLPRSYTVNSEIYERADGCAWNISFSDGTEKIINAPSDYEGAKICNFKENDFDEQDAIDAAMNSVLNRLDTNNDRLVDISIEQDDLGVDSQIIEEIPFLWGPTIIEVRVWG